MFQQVSSVIRGVSGGTVGFQGCTRVFWGFISISCDFDGDSGSF